MTIILIKSNTNRETMVLGKSNKNMKDQDLSNSKNKYMKAILQVSPQLKSKASQQRKYRDKKSQLNQKHG